MIVPASPPFSSPKACDELIEAVAAGLSMFDLDSDDYAGATDCEHGCTTEPDGHCRHGWLSAQETMFRTTH